MPKLEQDAQFSTPSPGQLLRRNPPRPSPSSDHPTTATVGIDVPCNPFQQSAYSQALVERGVMLAPLLVQWNYKIAAAKPFAKWLKTKDIILSDARMRINEDTAGVHYFGTYIAQEPETAPSGAARPGAVGCQTIWGFSSEAAMVHMFELCRGRVDRVGIVENDLRDFVVGLRGHINQAGHTHFSQSVLVAPAAM